MAHQMVYLSQRHTVSFALVCDPHISYETESERASRATVPLAGFYRIDASRPGKGRMIMDELLLTRPTFYARDYCASTLQDTFKGKEFDVLWAAPVGMGSFCEAYKESRGPDHVPKIVVGINEAMYYSYFEQGLAMIVGREAISFAGTLRLFRSLLLRYHEKKYLMRFDACHVQTENEARRTQKILPNCKPRVIVSQNGKHEELLDIPYTGAETKNVLLLAHMIHGRERQGVWFLRKVWPKVRDIHKDAVLHVVGLMAEGKLEQWILSRPGVIPKGFIPNLSDAYRNMTVSVVPVLQSTGVINRIVDAMSAGVPVVASPESISTIDGFRPGIHGISAKGSRETAIAISELLGDSKRLDGFSTVARQFVRRRFTWENSCHIIEKSLEKLTSLC
ncbi:glycosyltransferase family 4 protein [Planctomycetota bacterium]